MPSKGKGTSSKSSKKGQKTVSDANQRPNPNAAGKRKGQPSEDPRGPKHARTDGGPARTGPSPQLTADQQARELISGWFKGARYRDAPTNPSIKRLLKPRLCTLVVCPPPT